MPAIVQTMNKLTEPNPLGTAGISQAPSGTKQNVTFQHQAGNPFVSEVSLFLFLPQFSIKSLFFPLPSLQRQAGGKRLAFSGAVQ